MDFEHPKDLANYLHYLDSNKTAYNDYFKWKKHVMFNTNNNIFCNMCSKILSLFLKFNNLIVSYLFN
jgi:hypothetical protein